MAIFHQLPDSVFQLLAVFLSIIIEALPFVLLGSIVSGFIEVFLTPEKVQNFLPKNKVLAILFGTLVGFIFPSCECGIVPIITRFLEKKCLAIRLFLSCNGSYHQSSRSLCDLYGLWELLVLRDFTFSRSFLDCHDFGNFARLCGG